MKRMISPSSSIAHAIILLLAVVATTTIIPTPHPFSCLALAPANDEDSPPPAADDNSSSSNDNSNDNNNNNNILTTLTAQTNDTAQLLSQKSVEYTKLQSLLADKLLQFSERHSSLQAEVSSSAAAAAVADTTTSEISSTAEAMHEAMEEMSLKLLELIKRTEDVTKWIGKWNKAVLVGNDNGRDLQERLRNVMREEMERRDRFVAALVVHSQESEHDESTLAENNNENDHIVPPYMTITQLEQLLSTENIITPSEIELQSKFMALAKNMMEERTMNDEEFWKNHFETLPQLLLQQQQQQQQLANSQNDNGQCITIPSAIQLVANALTSHYMDGGIDMLDVASYENGGSVVYELTSLPYQPPPRNNNNHYHYHQQQQQQQQQELSLVDKVTERMYYEQQIDLMNSEHSDDGSSSSRSKINAALDKIDIWDWYTNFQFNSIRKYLPDDWERFLDKLSSWGYLGGSGGGGTTKKTTTSYNWGEYTPRGIVDSLIPDYVYHAFGISNMAGFGSVYGRTASPEVAITAGYSKVGGGVGGGGGWSAKALGNCYPLSMRLENDPLLSLLSRHTHMEGGAEVIDDDATISSLLGPKYTVRLPYPIHIDAVSIEHRAFPLPQSALNDGVRGGESAPRWVKVVGFPPCGDNDNRIEADEGCDKLGFDTSRPVHLGSFEYHPVTAASGRKDDYGGGDGDEWSNSDRRRRSIQTFTVEGGKVKGSGSEGEGGDDIGSVEPELEIDDYEIPAGSCAPPKEPEGVPSCGGGDMPFSSAVDQSERQIVSAVSFIIEENWGNNEYTCLYRVRVHGEPILE